MYIKNDYKISSLALILEASLKIIDGEVDGGTAKLSKIKAGIDAVKRISYPDAKLLSSAIWSDSTWKIDKTVYRVAKANEEAVACNPL